MILFQLMDLQKNVKIERLENLSKNDISSIKKSLKENFPSEKEKQKSGIIWIKELKKYGFCYIENFIDEDNEATSFITIIVKLLEDNELERNKFFYYFKYFKHICGDFAVGLIRVRNQPDSDLIDVKFNLLATQLSEKLDISTEEEAVEELQKNYAMLHDIGGITYLIEAVLHQSKIYIVRNISSENLDHTYKIFQYLFPINNIKHYIEKNSFLSVIEEFDLKSHKDRNIVFYNNRENKAEYKKSNKKFVKTIEWLDGRSKLEKFLQARKYLQESIDNIFLVIKNYSENEFVEKTYFEMAKSLALEDMVYKITDKTTSSKTDLYDRF
jgi:hypothetical protein